MVPQKFGGCKIQNGQLAAILDLDTVLRTPRCCYPIAFIFEGNNVYMNTSQNKKYESDKIPNGLLAAILTFGCCS